MKGDNLVDTEKEHTQCLICKNSKLQKYLA